MSVVQRCPNCGTTGIASGECEACHEATVRYFCTNHEPGLWLDAPACPTCGARYGEATRTAPPRRRERGAPAPARDDAPWFPEPTRGREPRPPEPARRREPVVPAPARDDAPWSPEPARSREPWPPEPEEVFEARVPPTTLLEQLLRAAASSRYRSRRVAPDRDGPTPRRGMGGCLLRFLLLLVLLFVALASGLFLFGRALLF